MLEFVAQVFKHFEIWKSDKLYFRIPPRKQISFNYQWKPTIGAKENRVYCGSIKPINYMSRQLRQVITAKKYKWKRVPYPSHIQVSSIT